MPEPDGNGPSRRDFIKATSGIIAGLFGAMISIPAIGYLIGPALQQDTQSAWVDLGTLADYPLKIPTLFQFTRSEVNGWERTGMSYGVFVVRLDDIHVRVFSNICTHLGCHVNWHPDLQQYVSPCHDGHFDLLGKNVSGPPPRPLDEFKTRIEANRIWIELPPFERAA